MTEDIQPIKDKQTVNAQGESVAKRIEGVVLRRLTTIEDKRGEIVEIFRPSWNFHPDPLVYVYQISIRPGAIKGWVMHKLQDDRIFISSGVMRWALFDNRPESPTYKLLNTFTFSDRNRHLFVIPKGVFHAVQNVGQTEAVFINIPNRAYNHEDPDKYRLPHNNDLIPFSFNDAPGW